MAILLHIIMLYMKNSQLHSGFQETSFNLMPPGINHRPISNKANIVKIAICLLKVIIDCDLNRIRTNNNKKMRDRQNK